MSYISIKDMEAILSKDIGAILSSVWVGPERMKEYNIVKKIIESHGGSIEIKDDKLRIKYNSGPFILDSTGLYQNKVSVRIIATDTDNMPISQMPTEGLDKNKKIQTGISQFQTDLEKIVSLIHDLMDISIRPIRIFFLIEKQFNEPYFVQNENKILKLNPNLFEKKNMFLSLVDILAIYKSLLDLTQEKDDTRFDD